MPRYTYQEFKDNFNISLNSQQEDAVKTIDGPVMLLAVPGSGKTTTLITRIGYLIFCCDVDPVSILTLTYTRAAAKDMSERFETMFGAEMSGKVQFRTINSICHEIVGKEMAFTKRIEILEEETSGIVRRIYHRVYGNYPTDTDVSEAKKIIAYIKNMQLDDEEIEALTIGRRPARTLFDAYQEEMRENSRLDFDDELVRTLDIFENNKDVLNTMQNKYKYVLVDEAQDTSKIQHKIIERIAEKNKNLFMVGDEDQSIYGFRAAYPEALLQFEKKYDRAKVLFLEENYRSTPPIVDAANRFIKTNSKRKDKKMYTSRTENTGVNQIEIAEYYDQYDYIVDCVRNEIDSTAILYRNHERAIPLIYKLIKSGTSYNCRGVDSAFFNHKLVRDVEDIILYAADPSNAQVFKRIYYSTGYYIRKEAAALAIKEFDPNRDRTMFHTICRLKGDINAQYLNWDAKNEILELNNDDAVTGMKRLFSKIRKIYEYEIPKYFILSALAEEGESMIEYLEKLKLLQKIMSDGSSDETSNLTLSTIHGCKGLEFDKVYVIDAIDTMLPAKDNSIEEERRLFYVAMTRAKDELNILRYKDYPMPFIDILNGEIEEEIKKETKAEPEQAQTSVKVTRTKPEPSKTSLELEEGVKVIHTKEGPGIITSVDSYRIKIKFENGEEKTYSTSACIENGFIKKA